MFSFLLAILLCAQQTRGRLEDTLQVVKLPALHLLDEVETEQEESTRVEVDFDLITQAAESGQHISMHINRNMIVESGDMDVLRHEAGELTGPPSIGDGPQTARFGQSGVIMRGFAAEVYKSGKGNSESAIPNVNGRMSISMEEGGHVSGFVDAEGSRYELAYDDDSQAYRMTLRKDAPPCAGDNAVSNSTDDRLLAMLPDTVRFNPHPRLAASEELKIAYFYECVDGSPYTSRITNVMNSVKGGALDDTLDRDHGLWSGPVTVEYCIGGVWPSANRNINTAINNIRNWFVSSQGNTWRNNNGVDIGVWLLDVNQYAGVAAGIPNFFQGTSWVRNAGDRTRSFAAVDPDSAISYHTLAHEIGHLMGFRHNRLADPNDWNNVNHGGAYFPGGINNNGDRRCFQTIMAYTSVCTEAYQNSPGPSSFSHRGRIGYFSRNSLYPDMYDFFRSGGNPVFTTQVDTYPHIRNSLDEIAKYA